MDAFECSTYTCEGCNALFESKRPKRFCTRHCNKRYLRRIGSQMTREQYLLVSRAAAVEGSKNYFYCQHCWGLSYRKLSGAHMANGTGNKFCSMACRVGAAQRARKEIEFLLGLATAFRRAKEKAPSISPALKRLASAISRFACHKEKAIRPCAICSRPVGYTAGAPRLYCSVVCSMKTEHAKQARKASKAKRKAIKRGANGGERINAEAVFFAAGWRCQICNKPTPQKLRGTHHKRAPEIDHVVPVSKGGSHTWANVQCACRECNAWKSNRIVIGQALLFGA